MPATSNQKERVVIVGVRLAQTPAHEAERSLDELESLVNSAGGEVVARVLQRRDRPDPATFVGKGKAQELTEIVKDLNADTTVFDEELSPAQLRNVEELVAGKVIDRTILILDIFAQRAHSAEGKVQVELAQLSYGLPRLRGWGIALSRQGAGAAAGSSRAPIGTRGPGETQLEIDRRRIERRLVKLKADLAQLEVRRTTSRRQRRSNVKQVSLAGYTNAGKSSLLNRLTGSKAAVANRLFVTLDPTTRRLRLPDGTDIVLTDTVGFIRKLPHGLVEAFKSTLEEVAAANLVVHVVDAAGPDPLGDIGAVDSVLEEIHAAELPRLVVFNKCDKATDISRYLEIDRDAIAVSAHTGEGIDELKSRIVAELASQQAAEQGSPPRDLTSRVSEHS